MPATDADATIVIPTRDEAGNVGPLLRGVSRALANSGLTCKVLFVDDSEDGSTVSAIERARESLSSAALVVEH
jgi:hypothetical protein